MLNHVHMYEFTMFGQSELIALTEEEHQEQLKEPDPNAEYLGEFVRQS